MRASYVYVRALYTKRADKSTKAPVSTCVKGAATQKSWCPQARSGGSTCARGKASAGRGCPYIERPDTKRP